MVNTDMRHVYLVFIDEPLHACVSRLNVPLQNHSGVLMILFCCYRMTVRNNIAFFTSHAWCHVILLPILTHVITSKIVSKPVHASASL